MKKDVLDNLTHVYTSVIPIRWGDMDAMGHVNNAVYFRFLEQARIEWYSFIGREKKAGMETVVVHAYCSFMEALAYPGEVEVRTYAGNPGRSSFDIVQEIRRTDNPDTVCARGGAKVVWVDPATGKSSPLPDVVRQLISAKS